MASKGTAIRGVCHRKPCSTKRATESDPQSDRQSARHLLLPSAIRQRSQEVHPTVHVHGKRRSRSSVVASSAGQLNSMLFIMDDNSAKRFLVDTGASVSVFPALHKDRHSGVRTPSLVAANGTNIATFGTREMSLTLDRCNYTWPFIIADVKTPLLGADFLQANALLVDLQSQRLLNAT